MKEDFDERSIALHEKFCGKLEMKSKVPVNTRDDLSLTYTPGVAAVCRDIAKNPVRAYHLTCKRNLVAIVTDGSRILGLGNIGPLAGLPVMEGKAILFKEFANVDAVPICLATQDANEIVDTVCRISPVFGGVNLEDIASPRCYEVEAKLQERLDIPVFHDDQHGTAIVALAGLINALKVVGKRMQDCTVVICGSGAAGSATERLLLASGSRPKNILMLDHGGILAKDREDLTMYRKKLAEETNPEQRHGQIRDAVTGADAFIGLSAANVLAPEWVRLMNAKPVIFALANPVPEIDPVAARDNGAAIVATGRSDFPNQVNNVLAFPGVFRGALDAHARRISIEMKLAAATALANHVRDPRPDFIIPEALDKTVALSVADAVKAAAVTSGVAQLNL